METQRPPSWIIHIEDPEARREAVAGLLARVQCGLCDRDERDISLEAEALGLALSDPDARVRAMAMDALRDALADQQEVRPAIASVAQVLRIPGHDLRPEAARFLAEAAGAGLDLARQESLLRRLAGDADPEVQRQALRAMTLRRVLRQDWTEVEASLDLPSPWERETVLRALTERRPPAGHMDPGPLTPAIRRHLAGEQPEVGLAAAMVVLQVPLKVPFADVAPALAAGLSLPRAAHRVEASHWLQIALARFIGTRGRRLGAGDGAVLERMVEPLAAGAADGEQDVRGFCAPALTAALLATGRQADLLARVQRLAPETAAVALLAMGIPTPVPGEPCRGPAGVAWTDLSPLLPMLRRHCRRADPCQAPAMRSLAQVLRHRGELEALARLFHGAPSALKLVLVRDLAGCRSRPCGAVDALVPSLVRALTGRHEALAREGLRALRDYAAPGAGSPPWRGELAVEEQARRAALVVESLGAAGLPDDRRTWELWVFLRAAGSVAELQGPVAALKKLAGQPRVEQLAGLLDHPHGQVRAWAARELALAAMAGSAPVQAAVPSLARALEHEDCTVRGEAALALGHAAMAGAAVEPALPSLLARVTREPMAPLRAVMARALGLAARGSAGPARILPALALGLSDRHREVRSECLSSLLALAIRPEGAAQVMAALAAPGVRPNQETRNVLQSCRARISSAAAGPRPRPRGR